MPDSPVRLPRTPAPVDELRVKTPESVRRTTVVDADGYRRSVRGVEITATRTGVGHEANQVMSLEDDHISITAAHVGFPMANSATTSDAVAAFVVFRTGAPGMRWDGVDVRDGLMLEFGASTLHVGTNLEGSCYSYAIIDLEGLQQRADTLGSKFTPVQRGGVRDVSAKPSAGEAARQLLAVSSLRDGVVPPPPLMDDLLSAFARALGLDSERRPFRTHKRVDRSSVIRRCVEFAASMDRRPSISELCRAAGVSERTLREAFVSAYDMPPSVFFRLWALDRAQRQLSSGEVIAGGVADVALAAGFGHLGRFAHYYRQVFGQLPSETYRLYVGSKPRRGLRRIK